MPSWEEAAQLTGGFIVADTLSISDVYGVCDYSSSMLTYAWHGSIPSR